MSGISEEFWHVVKEMLDRKDFSCKECRGDMLHISPAGKSYGLKVVGV